VTYYLFNLNSQREYRSICTKSGKDGIRIVNEMDRRENITTLH